MKRLLLILILTFIFQSLAKADDIRDFQIEGMSVGDNLLDYYTKDKIDRDKSFLYKNKKYQAITFWNVDSDLYDNIQFHFKDSDEKYTIASITGEIDYLNGVNKGSNKSKENCSQQKKKIDKELNKIFGKISKRNAGKYKHVHDKSGKSIVDTAEYIFTSGEIARVYCVNWSDEYNNQSPPLVDVLSVSINDKDFMYFLNNEAYK